MQIAIKGRNVPVTDEIRTHAERRLTKVARQVSDLARLEIEIFKEPNPRVANCQVAEGTLYLKGVTLRARDATPEMLHSLNLMVDELARQVKRHRDKLRHRRDRSRDRRRPPRSPRRRRAPRLEPHLSRRSERRREALLAAGPEALGSYPWPMPSLLDRALNVGEAKKFKTYQKRVALINAFEPELEHDTDAELRERMDELRERARGRRVARRPAAGVLRDRARDRQAHDGDAPFRRAADRRDGAARRADRRDEDRRGQDVDRDPGGRAQLAGGTRRRDRRTQGRAPGDRQRLPGATRRGMDEPDL